MRTPRAAAWCALLIAAATATACATPAADAHQTLLTPTATATARQKPPSCRIPAPDSARGYATMFAQVDPSQWGAADVGISVPLSDGRAVWLYGDTWSSHGAGRFVHSTAITQDRGCLRVSNGGAQLLPDGDGVWWWVEAGIEVRPGVLHITAEQQRSTGGSGMWAFEYTGITSTAEATVDRRGDVTFQRWVSHDQRPAADPGEMIFLGGPHFAYSVREHPEARLASGLTLWTAAQGWDDGTLHRFEDYAFLFVEATDRFDARAQIAEG